MHWPTVIERNRDDLLKIVAMLVLMTGRAVAGVLPRRVHRAVVNVLLPAEAALRRLIAIAAAQVTVEPREAGPMPEGGIPEGAGKRKRAPSFPLFDRRRSVDPKGRTVPGFGPNIGGFDDDEPRPPEGRAAGPDDPVDAERLARRLAAAQAALSDIPGQARRLARILAARRSRWLRVMRPGRPPGHRARGRHPVDGVLADCHQLALMALHEKESRAPP